MPTGWMKIIKQPDDVSKLPKITDKVFIHLNDTIARGAYTN